MLDDNNQPVSEGELGELTITTLGVEAMPLLRFKTGDMVQFFSEKCPCGRNTQRVGPILGRKEQMIKYKGTTIYPPAIYDLLKFFDQIQLYLIELYTNEIGNDEILIRVASADTSSEFLNQVKEYLQSKLRVTPKVEFADFTSLKKIVFNPLSRKPIYLVDKRNKKMFL